MKRKQPRTLLEPEVKVFKELMRVIRYDFFKGTAEPEAVVEFTFKLAPWAVGYVDDYINTSTFAKQKLSRLVKIYRMSNTNHYDQYTPTGARSKARDIIYKGLKFYVVEGIELPHNAALELIGFTQKTPADDRDKKRTFTNAEVKQVMALQNNRCYSCGAIFDDFNTPVGDHLVPHSKGGKTIIENLGILCVPCNSKKKDSHPTQFIIKERELRTYGRKSL